MKTLRLPLAGVLIGFALLVTLTHCARLSLTNEVAIVGRNFDDEVQRTQNLTFSFNKNVGPRLDGPAEENRIGEWDSTQYVRFKPAVRGKFRWTSPSELVFSPATAFDPATNYRAELTSDILRNASAETRKDLNVSGEEIEFHTPFLQLTGLETWWTRSRETGQPVAKTRLNFNYPVTPGDAVAKLTVTAGSSDTKPITTQLAPTDQPQAVIVTLQNAPSEQEDQPLTASIDRGLKIQNAAYTTPEPIKQTGTLPNRTAVDIVDVQTSFDNNGDKPQGVVRVITTQELQPGNLSQYYTIQPEVETTAELTANGFIIKGNFNETDTYVLTLTDQIRGVLNTKLAEAVTKDLFFGKMPASISFAKKKAMYLSSKGARNVGLNIVNVPNVQVKVAKVYENNLIQFLKNGRYEGYEEDGEGNYAKSGTFDYQPDDDEQYSNILVNKAVQTDNLPRAQGVSALNVSVPDQGGNYRGVYLVSVQSKEDAYLRATQLVSVSDIGLVARQTDDEILVWANSIRTAEPLKNIDITLISSNNQAVGTLKTDADGFAKFEKVSEKAPGFSVAMLTATQTTENRTDDFNFLYLPDTEVETSRFEIDGKRDNPSGFDALIYGDRDIYRPGETIHINTVVRNQVGTKAVGDIPLTIRLLLPNGRDAQVVRKQTNSEGAVTTDFPLDPATVTGTYTVEVQNANGLLTNSQAISVEEFIPDRIKVETRTDRTVYKAGQMLTLSATALNLFGPPASDRAYEMELSLKRRAFLPKEFAEYSFDTPTNGPAITFEKVPRQGRTNANGQATETFQLPATYQDIGILEGKVYVSVFDENGRPVNRIRKFDVLTQDVFFGIRAADHYVSTNTPVAIDLVAVDKDGTLKPGASASVDVIRIDYQTVIEKKNDQLRYSTKRLEKTVYTNALTFKGGKAEIKYVPTVSGEYAIRVRRPGAQGYTELDFYAYSYGNTAASSFEVSQEGQVLMTFDKDRYETGDRAKILFKCPFNGKLLVTVERNRVLEHHWLTTDNKAAEWTLSVGDEHLPNVYITATLIRPMAPENGPASNLPLTVAHGFAPLLVTDADTQLPVTIEAVAQSRSKTKQTIRIKTRAGAQVTVAVVDEGILGLKNFKTPDPHGFFYQKRALEVGSHDLYALLFPELSIASGSSTGGDGYDLERRVNPLSNGRVRLVALWSGILEAGFTGETEFTVDIPQFSGDLRVMAVAYKGSAFGSSAKNMKVADPIVISAGIPRFLSPGDELDLPITLTNTTQKVASLTAKLAVSGPLEIVTDSLTKNGQKLTIQPGRESRAMFRVRARQAIGPGAITITANALGENFTENTSVAVRPAASLQKTTQTGVIAGGKSQQLTLAANFLRGTTKATLTVSRSPAAQYGRELSYLLGYPHGCIEQTISKVFPQLYFAELTKTMGAGGVYFVKSGDSDLNPATNIRYAIQKIESHQTPDGGFSMWPAQPKPDDWATAYALHFLTEAAQAGYAVRPAVMSKAIDFLTNLTNGRATEYATTFDEAGAQTFQKVTSRTTIYGLYALALAEKPNRPAMNYYKNAVGSLTSDSRYLLASAFMHIGDTRSQTALLPKRFADNTTTRQNGGSYASPIRNLALTLETLLDTDPGNGQIPTMARQLSGAIKQNQYLNTQEAAFAFLALGKLAKQNAGSTASASVLLGSKSLGSFSGTDLVLKRVPTGQPITLKTAGSGNLYYFAQSEGVPTSGLIADEDNGLQVRRAYLNRNGEPMTSIRQNDLVVVEITVSSAGPTVENVVVTDLLPAGFEIENPRLTEARDMPWLPKATQPDYFDVRDDRINFYTNATREGKVFYYLVRAVSRGKFVVGPVSADAMYNGELRSYSGKGVVVVQ